MPRDPSVQAYNPERKPVHKIADHVHTKPVDVIVDSASTNVGSTAKAFYSEFVGGSCVPVRDFLLELVMSRKLM